MFGLPYDQVNCIAWGRMYVNIGGLEIGGLSVPVTVVVADDHPHVSAALQDCAITSAIDVVMRSATGLRDVMKMAGTADLLVLDPLRPSNLGFAGLLSVHQHFPKLPLLLCSASQDPAIAARARACGAWAYVAHGDLDAQLSPVLERLLKASASWQDSSSLRMTDRHSLNGEGDLVRRLLSLTPAQLRVLVGLTEGLLNKQIAYDMSISEATVKAHVTAVFRKLNVFNRTQAVILVNALQLEPSGAQERAHAS
jgi:DNA-binding NarL/FixJ family response regulator